MSLPEEEKPGDVLKVRPAVGAESFPFPEDVDRYLRFLASPPLWGLVHVEIEVSSGPPRQGAKQECK